MPDIPRGFILRPDYVKENKVKCERCDEPAYATYYDVDWETHEYCFEHYPAKLEGAKQ